MYCEEVDAVNDSIGHWWKDILEPCLRIESKGRVNQDGEVAIMTISPQDKHLLWIDLEEGIVPCYSKNCPLCILAINKNKNKYYTDGILACFLCPITKLGHPRCSRKNSVWKAWCEKPNSSTATQMIELLKSLLPKEGDEVINNKDRMFK